MWDSIWINARLYLGTNETGRTTIDNGALATSGHEIAWAGELSALPAPPASLARQIYDARGKWITPGFVDCHTHLVYAGNRSREFLLRLGRASYREIAEAGGGIFSTMQSTRQATGENLLATARNRLLSLMKEGVTTVEIKSGYGLDAETELRQLRVAKNLGAGLPVNVRTTFLALHALPPEFRNDRSGFVDLMLDVLDRVAEEHLADAVDAYCETIAFTPQEVERLFRRAAAKGMAVKIHAEQLSRCGGTMLAASCKALSADHLEYAGEADVAAMKKAGTVAVLLPVPFYCLREKQLPPIELLRRSGVPIAIATDCNPGTSPCTSLRLAMNMACTQFGLTLEEALAGVTANAARALGMDGKVGSLKAGMQADFLVWEIDELAELACQLGELVPSARVWRGECYPL